MAAAKFDIKYLDQYADRPLLHEKRASNLVYRVISSWVNFAMSTFYRHTFVSGLENMPHDRGCILAANHWNMAIDIGALIQSCPRKVHFWTKAELFKGPPGLESFMHAMGCLPVKRNSRSGKAESNESLFSDTTENLIKGGVIAIFPEGTSHHTPHLTVVKDGTAWAALQFASTAPNAADYAPIIPVGITYEPDKTRWRTDVHVRYGKPIDVAPYVQEFKTDPKNAVKKLTTELDHALRKLTANAADWAALDLASKARQIALGKESARRDVAIFNTIAEAFHSSNLIINSAQERLTGYWAQLRSVGLQDGDVESSFTTLPWLMIILAFNVWLAFLSTVAIAPSFIIHLPALLLLGILAKREKFEESKAQLQIFSAHVIVPLSYGVWFFLLKDILILDTWATVFWFFFGLTFFGYIYPGLEDIRRETYTSAAQSWRLLVVALRKDQREALETLKKGRKDLREILLKVIKTPELTKKSD
ncbi:hypothetical protein DFS34DRAFT_158095 [Phlyctochytrium arcticum]|nr:hypothetical protein DFS34DRAFT_158095 [Phlyctochytrium arcticum]